jgi:hypothetical protein
MRYRWCLSTTLAVFVVGFTGAADPPSAAPDLSRRVAQLGADDFDHRNDAEKRLIALGTSVLPILEALEPFGDPEVELRVLRLRRVVGGKIEEIRQALDVAPAIPPPDIYTHWPLPPDVANNITANQPQAGDFLLSVIGDPKHRLHRAAVNAFVQSWETMTGDQIRTYLLRSLILSPYMARPAYPRGIDGGFAMGLTVRYDYGGRPEQNKQVKITTVTEHFVDGKPYGKPSRYGPPGGVTGHIKAGEMSVGRHTAAMATRFELIHRGQTVTGSVRSEDFPFEVLPADTPDDLIAPKDAEMEKLVRSALRIAETEESFETQEARNQRMFRGAWPQQETDWWRPQSMWQEANGLNSLYVPVWRLEKPLPVDLCFSVTVRIEATGEEYEAYPLVVLKGTTTQGLSGGYFMLRGGQDITKGRTGFIPVRLILRPSRSSALYSLKVTRYYPGEIVTEPLRLKIGPPKPEHVPQGFFKAPAAPAPQK